MCDYFVRIQWWPRVSIDKVNIKNQKFFDIHIGRNCIFCFVQICCGVTFARLHRLHWLRALSVARVNHHRNKHHVSALCRRMPRLRRVEHSAAVRNCWLHRWVVARPVERTTKNNKNNSINHLHIYQGIKKKKRCGCFSLFVSLSVCLSVCLKTVETAQVLAIIYCHFCSAVGRTEPINATRSTELAWQPTILPSLHCYYLQMKSSRMYDCARSARAVRRAAGTEDGLHLLSIYLYCYIDIYIGIYYKWTMTTCEEEMRLSQPVPDTG